MASHKFKTKKVTLDEFFSEQLTHASYIDVNLNSNNVESEIQTFKVKSVELQPISLKDFFMKEGISITRTATTTTTTATSDCDCELINGKISNHDIFDMGLSNSSTDSMLFESVVYSNDGSNSGFTF
ncbi:hypothetical protein EIJ81_00585 (plasmid) [Aliivibrio salmonicida]|uniref:hypothetical protein n=1 Tax=Aliivibrio salmonicida TaxID=40269 RepID=UPI000F6FFA90|nr:hypothetical protein [Aliivibrio salmonicida]AZL83395.1 hypothetical protein EIJ81_00585 [Aliivibrio salmonicida]